MTSRVPAAEHALAVLRHLARQAGPVPAAAIARDVGLPRSTTYHLLAVLVEQGFVVHLPEEHRYGVGVAAFELGSAYSRQAPLTRLARPVLARLVDRVGQSAHLAVLHGSEVLYLVEERAPGRPSLITDVGVRLPAQLTASGRAFKCASTDFSGRSAALSGAHAARLPRYRADPPRAGGGGLLRRGDRDEGRRKPCILATRSGGGLLSGNASSQRNRGQRRATGRCSRHRHRRDC